MEKYDRCCEYSLLPILVQILYQQYQCYILPSCCFIEFYLAEDFSNCHLEFQEKSPYVQKAEKRKTEYNKKMQAYNLKLVNNSNNSLYIIVCYQFIVDLIVFVLHMQAGGGNDDESDKSKSEVNDEDEEDEVSSNSNTNLIGF